VKRAPAAVFVLGPTASGKSAVALALAGRFPAEIVSVDSAQVYRGMDIGTAKPDRATQQRVPHHLIDLIDPVAAYSAARFAREARAAMADITARGRLPLLVGGTMLYVKALTEGLSTLPEALPELRRELDARAAIEGWPALHTELARLDPVTAARLAPGDSQRIGRALEVCIASGVPMSSLLARRAADLGHRMLMVSLEPSDRAVLHQRIAARFRRMLDDGLVEELQGLRARFALTAALPAMRAVGYRQAWEFLDGAIDAAALEAKGIAATRQLAKRQLTWLRSMTAVERFDCLREDLAQAVAARVEDFLAADAQSSP
jgi:tRNA dimethylallyltransferase